MGNLKVPDDKAASAVSITRFYTRETWIEGRAEDQLQQVSCWPGMSAIAAFPDLHPGRHGPVGAAFLADRIYPQLVGPDIGCGMALFRLDMPRRKLRIDKSARRLRVLEAGLAEDAALSALSDAGLACSAPHGLGTIGGGNHFCEVQVVETVIDPYKAQNLGIARGDMCLLVHSGSRSLGASVFNGIDDTWKDGFLPGSDSARQYLDLHNKANRWAKLSRSMIAGLAADALNCDLEPICDAVHNNVEPWRGAWLHRKGAASPDRGTAPLAGSRDSLSYLMDCGTSTHCAADLAAGREIDSNRKAAPDTALGSLSHGAGRRYDRGSMHGRIRKTRSGLAEMSRTRFGGMVICENPDLMIEEAGHAYKDSASVAADLEQFGVASRILALAPLITYKTARSDPGDTQ